jgi:hypothetical protein
MLANASKRLRRRLVCSAAGLIPEPTMAVLALQGLIAMALAARTKSATPSPSRSDACGVEVVRREPVGLASREASVAGVEAAHA